MKSFLKNLQILDEIVRKQQIRCRKKTYLNNIKNWLLWQTLGLFYNYIFLQGWENLANLI